MISDLQKASMWKRISAFLFDAITLGIIVVLIAFLMSSALGYDGYNNTLNERYAHYEAQFGVNFRMTLTEYESMSPEQVEALDRAYAALSADDDAVYAYDMLIQLTLTITSISILMGYLIVEFAVPLYLKNGQTLGKKIFGVALMRTDGVRVSRVTMFVRTVLGKYAIETMIPALILMMIYFGSIGVVGPIVLVLVALTEIILLIATRNNSMIHDLLAQTVAVDLASQRIFDSKEDMIAYKQKLHAEKAAAQAY